MEFPIDKYVTVLDIIYNWDVITKGDHAWRYIQRTHLFGGSLKIKLSLVEKYGITFGAVKEFIYKQPQFSLYVIDIFVLEKGLQMHKWVM